MMKRFLKRAIKLILLMILVPVAVIGVRLLLGWLLAEEPQLPGADDPALRERALAIHRQATVFDGHNDLPVWMLDFGFDLAMDGNQSDDRSPMLYMAGPFASSSSRPTGDDVRTHTDLGRIREGGLDAQFFAIWVACSYIETPGASMQRAVDMIANLKQQLDSHQDAAELALTAGDVQRIVAEERLAALMS
jgi:membrane dipeptidase